MKKLSIILVFAAAVALVFAASASASSIVLMDLDRMAKSSAFIVKANVASVQAEWDDDHARIWTTVELDVQTFYRGAATEDAKLSFVVPGGEVGEIGQIVPGAPEFKPGEQVIVLLDRSGPDDALLLVGFNQGKLVRAGTKSDGTEVWARAVDLKGIDVDADKLT